MEETSDKQLDEDRPNSAEDMREKRIGRPLSDIIQTRADERAAEIERERDDGEGPRS